MDKNHKVVLEVKDLHTYYGLSHILFGVSLVVRQGEVTCLLGRNGAGKTTLIKSICGLVPASSGEVWYQGKNIIKTPAYRIAASGIIPAFSDNRVFGNLTVRENLEIGKMSPRSSDKKVIWTIEKVYELFPILKEFEKRWAGSLSGGQQQILCVAKALMGNPELLILDEPTIGLAPVVIESIGEQVEILKAENTSILLTEQNVKFASKLGDTCSIIDMGEIKFQGTFGELYKNESIVSEYLSV
ncbi:MAG TPA: ABC transporter ATP-binding protein [Syntrophorhabdus sp.]|jgi:branched-chain amino acid transport system ATP-binding protein|nr:ABC transporter ATP-binding protein [Syntrophorhabdus sp.]